jgi:hypothetical protein
MLFVELASASLRAAAAQYPIAESPGRPSPEQPESLSMPSDQRLRLDDDQELAPLDQPGQPDERKSDRVIGSTRPDLPLDVQRQLLAKEQILGGELGARSQHRCREPEDVCQNVRDYADVKTTTVPGHSTRIARGEGAGITTGGPSSATATKIVARRTDHRSAPRACVSPTTSAVGSP